MTKKNLTEEQKQKNRDRALRAYHKKRAEQVANGAVVKRGKYMPEEDREIMEASALERKRKFGKERSKKFYRKNSEKLIKQQMARYEKNKEQYMWNRAKDRAAKKNLEFNIGVEDIVIPSICPVLGTPMEKPSLDRIDNTKGYVKGNVCVISGRANTIKNDACIEELEKILLYMKKYMG